MPALDAGIVACLHRRRRIGERPRRKDGLRPDGNHGIATLDTEQGAMGVTSAVA